MHPIPQESWKWFGRAGHFIGAADCLFHLCTQVGSYLISTVGDYRPRKGETLLPAMEIGARRKYETYVFRTTGKPGRDCGCGMPDFVLMEIEGVGSNDDAGACTNHFVMCHKYAAMPDEPATKGANDG